MMVWACPGDEVWRSSGLATLATPGMLRRPLTTRSRNGLRLLRTPATLARRGGPICPSGACGVGARLARPTRRVLARGLCPQRAVRPPGPPGSYRIRRQRPGSAHHCRRDGRSGLRMSRLRLDLRHERRPLDGHNASGDLRQHGSEAAVSARPVRRVTRTSATGSLSWGQECSCSIRPPGTRRAARPSP